MAVEVPLAFKNCICYNPDKPGVLDVAKLGSLPDLRGYQGDCKRHMVEADTNDGVDMKPRYLVLIGVALVLAALIVGRVAEAQNAAQQTPKVVKWEYTDGANLNIAQMNALGEQGWEMCTFVSYGKDLYYIFKRPK
jgi:hypothetical protein